MIEYGWYVGRGDCGVCGWKDRCRDGNLRTYCHVSPILFGCFFVEASPTCFCIFVKCFFCNLFPGIFGGKWAFLVLHSLSMNFFHFKNVLPATCFCCFLGVREIICCGSARYKLFTGKVEADLSDDVTASCYDCLITTQVHVHVLSCIIF